MKLFNGIIGVFALFAATFCFFFPGRTFLNSGWIVTLMLCSWGICALFETATNHGENKPDNATKAKGGIALVSGLITGAASVVGAFSPAYKFATDMTIVGLFVFWMLVSGVSSVIKAVRSRSNPDSRWCFTLILGILTLIAGIYGIFHVFVMAWTMTIMFGILLTFYGLRLLTSIME